MEQIVVLREMLEQDGFERVGPVDTFLSNLAHVSAGQVITQKATFIEVADAEFARLIERVLDANGKTFFRVPTLESEPAQNIPAAADVVDKHFPELAEVGIILPEVNTDRFLAPEPGVVARPLPVVEEDPMEPVNAQQDHATVAIESDPLCPECRQPFHPDRKSQIYCKRPECAKARASRYARESFARKREQQQAEKPEPEPGAVLVEVDEKPEVVNLEDELEAALNLSPAYDRDRIWQFEDGPRKGTYMTSADLRRLLAAGNLKNGQHLRHRHDGRHEVQKCSTGISQKLVCLYGEKAGQSILAGEL